MILDGGNKGLALVYRLVSQSLPSRKLSSPHELGEISFHTLDSIIYTWTLMTIVSANAPYSYFGYSVALHNSTLVVGAPGTIDYLQNSPPIRKYLQRNCCMLRMRSIYCLLHAL